MLRTITTIEPQVRRPRRVNLYVDGKFVGGFSLAVIQDAGLSVGQTIDEADLADLLAVDVEHRALESAYNFLSYRPRSEREIRQRLRKHGYQPEVIDRTIEHLRAQQLIDDAAFAEYWRQNRQSFRPRGSRLLRIELRQKGVDAETAAAATADIDETAAALEAARKPAQRFKHLPYQEFRQKLWAFLGRRGFNFEDSRRAIEQLWQEVGGPATESDDLE